MNHTCFRLQSHRLFRASLVGLICLATSASFAAEDRPVEIRLIQTAEQPGHNWGDKPGGWNLVGAKRLVFWARGERGDEVVSFQFGLVGADKRYHDTAKGEIGKVHLTTEWKPYSIDLTGKDLTRIVTGFAWIVAGQGKPVTFYLDDVRYE